jgi:hypothetical protein
MRLRQTNAFEATSQMGPDDAFDGRKSKKISTHHRCVAAALWSCIGRPSADDGRILDYSGEACVATSVGLSLAPLSGFESTAAFTLVRPPSRVPTDGRFGSHQRVSGTVPETFGGVPVSI